MSGPEWTNDEPEARDDSPRLSRRVGREHEHDQAPEPAMDSDHESPDRVESAPDGASGATAPPDRPGFLAMALALLSKIPLPSLGSERHEVLPDVPHPSPTPVEVAHEPEEVRDARSSPLALSRETRVGIAAVLSFALLVGALVVKRRMDGRKSAVQESGKEPVVLALHKAGEGDPASDTSDKGGEAKLPKAGSKKDAQGERSKPKVAGSASTPTPSGTAEAARAPEPDPVPVESTASKPTLGGDPAAGEAVAMPPPAAGGSSPPVLGSTLATPPPPPNSLPPKPPESPPEPANPLSIPDASTATSPPELPPPNPGPGPSTHPEPPPAPSKPNPAELNPSPANGPPPMGDPPTPPPMVEAASAPPVLAEPPAPPPLASTAGPVRTETPLSLESVPTSTAGSVEPSATRASTAGALGAGWVVIPSGGRRVVGPAPIVSTPSDVEVDRSKVADGPRFTDDAAAADQVEPVVHTVGPGENFWTISILYYRSGRFYKALHAANRAQVPDIRKLYVGTILRIPPPEALDRTLIDPATRSDIEGSLASKVSRTSKRAEPVDDVDLATPTRPRVARPDPEADAPPRRPTYVVKAYETLRSIARDTLNDPRRSREIYNLNRDVLGDINVPPDAGTTLTLPDDAIVGRRAR